MSSLLTILLRNECRRICSKCLLDHCVPKQTIRRFHKSKWSRKNDSFQQGVDKVKKTSLKRKLAYGLGLGCLTTGVVYVSLEEPSRRKIRVVIGGVGRFLRLDWLTAVNIACIFRQIDCQWNMNESCRVIILVIVYMWTVERFVKWTLIILQFCFKFCVFTQFNKWNICQNTLKRCKIVICRKSENKCIANFEFETNEEFIICL